MSKLFLKTFVGLVVLGGLVYYSVQNNVRFFFVVTGSMEPVIPTKSIILSRKISGDTVKAGAVIVFNDQATNHVTAHRVKEVIAEGFVTKGDANEYQDRGLVKSVDLLGEVLLVVPIVDAVSVFTQVGLLILIFMLGVLVRRFLICLKHGFSCPTATLNALFRLCVFRRSKATFCNRSTGFGAY